MKDPLQEDAREVVLLTVGVLLLAVELVGLQFV